jgi:hypothetical protein
MTLQAQGDCAEQVPAGQFEQHRRLDRFEAANSFFLS